MFIHFPIKTAYDENRQSRADELLMNQSLKYALIDINFFMYTFPLGARLHETRSELKQV